MAEVEPATKIDKNKQPIIVFTFAAKGLSLYFARLNILKVGQTITGEMQKK